MSDVSQDRVRLHAPLLGDEEAQAVAEVLASGWLVQGPRVRAFEEGLAKVVGTGAAVAVSSGTAALHVGLRALGLAPGEEVIVPGFGYPATANAVELCGARAVPADVDAERMALSAASVDAAASARTVGVVVVHAFGIPAPMAELEALCAARGWWLLEDAACALGTAPEGRWGSGRHAACLSFHPRKTITTAEGGAILTNDEALEARLRVLRNQGVGAPDGGRWSVFEEAGFNYRLSEVHAAIGLVQLDRLASIVEARQRVVGWYLQALQGVAEVRVPEGYRMPELGMQSFVVEWLAGDRDRVMDTLRAGGVEVTIGGYDLGAQPYYRRRYGHWRGAVASRLAEQALTMPVRCDMTVGEVERVVEALRHVG